MLSFDLASIPSGASIQEATLYLDFVTSCYYTGHSQPRTVTVYRASSSWSESSVTWNNKPGYAEAHDSASVGVTSSALGWYSFDVTDLVSGWMVGTYPNYGVVVRGPETSGSEFVRLEIAASETSYDPYLEVTYIGSASSVQQVLADEETAAPEPVSSSYQRVLGIYPSSPQCAECVQGRAHFSAR
jgi:hypothetical protein